MTYTLNFYKKTNKNAKRNLMSTLELRDVLDGISEACSMIVYFYIWNLTWINLWRIEEITNANKIGEFIIIIIYWRFMESCAALRWFYTRIWLFPVFTVLYLQQSICFDVLLCIYTCCTSFMCAAFVNFSEVLYCVFYSACFHTISLCAFVFRNLPSLLLFLTDRRPPGLLPAHSLVEGTFPTP